MAIFHASGNIKVIFLFFQLCAGVIPSNYNPQSMGEVLDIIKVLLMSILKGLLRIATKEKLSRDMVGGSHQYGKKKVVFKQLTMNLEVI